MNDFDFYILSAICDKKRPLNRFCKENQLNVKDIGRKSAGHQAYRNGTCYPRWSYEISLAFREVRGFSEAEKRKWIKSWEEKAKDPEVKISCRYICRD